MTPTEAKVLAVLTSAIGSERCEWNPRFHEPSSEPPAPGDCQNVAMLCVGRSPSWHVCESCAAEPRFRRYRVRVPLRRAPPQEAPK